MVSMLQDNDTIRIQDLNEAAVHGILEVISDGIWDWNANTGFVYTIRAGIRCWAMSRTPSTTRYSPGKT